MKRTSKRPIWVVVTVNRGLPAKVEAFDQPDKARKREQRLRKNINLDYEETDTFKVKLK